MSGFSRLEVDGFRRLCQVDLPLESFNVLIGANGIGKTSVLEVFELLAASAGGRLRESLSSLGGIAALRTNGRSEGISLRLETPVEQQEPIHYEVVLQPSGPGYDIPAETLTQQQRAGAPEPYKFIESRGPDIRYFDPDQKTLRRPTWEHDPLETSLSQVPKMYRMPEQFRQTLASSTLFHVLDVSPRAPVRLPQPMRPASLPGSDGGDLISCLYWLRESEAHRFEAIEDALRAAFPSFEKLSFPPAAAGTLTMAWKDRNFDGPLYPHQLSEGTLRFLWLITLLQSPHLPTVTLIDEPEVSLHPEMLGLLVDLMREASDHTQLIVATHSDRLVRHLEPHEVVACDLSEEGTTLLTRADQLDLEAWMKDYSMDELWSLGRLGGRAI